MSFKYFPKVSNIIGRDATKPPMMYAVIMDGRLLATDGTVAVDILLSSFMDDPDSIKNLEGKALNLEALKVIERDGAIFGVSGITSLKGLKIEYSGEIDASREIVLQDLQTAYTFPNIKAVFSNDNTTIGDRFDLGIDPKQLQKIADCLSSPYIKLRWYAYSKAYLIHAGDEENQRAILMPVIFPE